MMTCRARPSFRARCSLQITATPPPVSRAMWYDGMKRLLTALTWPYPWKLLLVQLYQYMNYDDDDDDDDDDDADDDDADDGDADA